MRILVTGGCGYVGSHVVHALHARGADLVVVDDLSAGHADALPAGVPLVRADVLEAPIDGVGAIVHLASLIEVGASVRDPRAYWRVNVAHGLSLFERAIDAGVRRFVLSSSAAVYGEPRVTPIPEEHALAPASPYGESKRVLEAALASYARSHGVTWCALRYFNAAGATPDKRLGERHDPETHLVPLAVGAALGRRPPLRVFGDRHPTRDGTCVRDYVHVRDLADAHARALEVGVSGAINLGTGVGSSVREVLGAVERAAGAKVPHTIEPAREGDPATLVASRAKAERVLGWKPTHDLDAIVRDVVAFERAR